MKPLPAVPWPQSRKVLGFWAWAVFISAISVSLSLLFHVWRRGIDWTTAFGPNPERSWDGPLWLRW